MKTRLGITAVRTSPATWAVNQGTLVSALTDGSDSTWARSAVAGAPCILELEDPTRTDAMPVAAAPWGRARKPGASTARLRLMGFYAGKKWAGWVPWGCDITVPTTDTVVELAVAPREGATDLYHLGVQEGADAGALALALVDSSGGSDPDRAYVTEAGVDLWLLEPAQVSILGPASPVRDMRDLAYEVRVRALVEDWQRDEETGLWLNEGTVELRVYAAADVPPGATEPPPRITPVTWLRERYALDWVDGETPSEATIVAASPAPLPNGSYVLFARADRDRPHDAEFWSAWARHDFVVDVVPPSPPAVAAAADADRQCMKVTVTVPSEEAFDPESYVATLERSEDGGYSWRGVRHCDEVPVRVGDNVLEDWEAPRGATVLYRARVTAALVADGTRLVSDWGVSAEAQVYPVSGWNLKAVDDPARNWVGVPVLVDPEAERLQEVTVYTPLDGDGAVTVAGPDAGVTGRISVWCDGNEAVSLADGLVHYDGLVLLEDGWGASLYVRVTGASWTAGGTPQAPWRVLELEYVQTSEP